MKKIKVGIIGFGLSGKTFHVPLLLAHDGYQIEMICSSRTDEIKSILPEVKITSDPYNLINHKDLDLIINCAPNSFHYSYSEAVLKSGKNVVVEKPFVNSVIEGQQLISLAKSIGKVLTVFHNRRWDADFLTIKKIIASGKLGKIQQFESHFDRWRPIHRAERWREQGLIGSGLFYDFGPHLLDQALSLFGIPDELTADICSQKEGALSDDYFHIVLKYKTMRAILHASSFSNTTPRFQIYGDQGCFTKYGIDPQEDQLKQNIPILSSAFGKEEEIFFGTIAFPNENRSEKVISEKGNYRQFYDDLYKLLATGQGHVPVLAEDALRVIKLIENSIQSSNNGTTLKIGELLNV